MNDAFPFAYKSAVVRYNTGTCDEILLRKMCGKRL